MKCIAFIIPITEQRRRMFGCGGTHNGYVAVPPEHPCHGLDYDNKQVSGLAVHGGLTLASPVLIRDADGMFKVAPEYIGKRWPELDENAEYLDGATKVPDDWWIFGFDTLHFGDNEKDWCREAVIDETMRLKEQFERMAL